MTYLGWGIMSGYGDSRLEKLKWITGTVRGGDAHYAFDHFCKWYNDNIEKIDPKQSWGFAPRKIAGSSTTSRHAYGNAMDINAAKHPQFRNTLTTKQIDMIRAKLKSMRGVIRWGGDWFSIGRGDQMHYEINVTPARLKEVVDALKAGSKPGGDVKPTTPSKPVPRPPAGKPDAYKTWVKKLQTELNKWKTDLPKLRVDGDYGSLTVRRVKEWQKRNKGGAYKGIYIDGKAGPLTCKGLGIPNPPKK